MSELLKSGSTNGAGVRFLSGVGTFVCVEMRELRETGVACSALVRPFSSVDSLMSFHS